MAVHIAYVRPTLIDANGVVVDKNNYSTTIQQVYNNTSSEPRVQPGPNAPNAATYPTIEAYLVAEDLAGYSLQHMDNNMIVTKQ